MAKGMFEHLSGLKLLWEGYIVQIEDDVGIGHSKGDVSEFSLPMPNGMKVGTKVECYHNTVADPEAPDYLFLMTYEDLATVLEAFEEEEDGEVGYDIVNVVDTIRQH